MPGLLQKQYQDDEAAREHLEKLLWKDGPVCPHCGVIGESTKLEMQEGTKTHARKGVYQCNGCRKQFTVTIGTIFEDSHIPLHKWLLAIHLMCSSKKGISALQLQRNLELGSYRTAWFMCHRIRWAMTQSPMTEALMKGVVEVDETYVGGREKGMPGMPNPLGRGSKKTPVLALVERGGNVRSFPMLRITSNNVRDVLTKHVDPATHLVTDEASVYQSMDQTFDKHSTVVHKKKEYVRREEGFTVTTNTIESYFSLLKRSNYGTFHHWSRKYLPSYCAELDFRYNARKISDDERTIKCIKAIEGKRLMLKHPKNVD